MSRPPRDPRLPLVEAMMDQVREGYFATLADSSQAPRFLRVSRPTKGEYKDTLKVQTQHGPRWNIALVYHPAKTYRGAVMDAWWAIESTEAIGDLLLIISDQKGCMLRYGRELLHCCKCNTELTDQRSRHYGIGPDCEKVYPDVIEEVDDSYDGHSFEWLRAHGMIEEY